MYEKSTRPSAQRDDRVLRNAKRDDQIARPRCAQTCELRAKRAMRMCPQSGQNFFINNEVCNNWSHDHLVTCP